MELIRLKLNDTFKNFNPVVATIGQFDGLHIAHLELIKKMLSIAKKKNLKSAIFTFDPHPDFILKKDLSNTYVTPLNNKIKMLESLEIDYLFVIEFDERVASIEPKDFIDKYLMSNHVVELVVGFDFTFGFCGKGKAEDIKQLSNHLITTDIIEEIKYENNKIGTSLIRDLLKKGQVKIANQLLGRCYRITGKVVKGNQIGRTINLPTANFEVDEQFASICPGVYVVRVIIDNQSYYGFANLGVNPSFNRSKKMVFETHIFNFNELIYDKIIDVELLDFIRHEINFKSIEDFLVQINKDKEYAYQICANLASDNKIKKATLLDKN